MKATKSSEILLDIVRCSIAYGRQRTYFLGDSQFSISDLAENRHLRKTAIKVVSGSVKPRPCISSLWKNEINYPTTIEPRLNRQANVAVVLNDLCL